MTSIRHNGALGRPVIGRCQWRSRNTQLWRDKRAQVDKYLPHPRLAQDHTFNDSVELDLAFSVL